MFAILLLFAALYLRLTAARPPTTLSTTTFDPAAIHTLTPRAPLPTVPGPALTTDSAPSPTPPPPAPPAPPAPIPTPPPTTPNPYIIPTSYLSQVPALWPYTKYGICTGKERETATWGITDGDGVTVAVVKASVLGYKKPREGERDGLEGWRRTFVVPRETGE